LHASLVPPIGSYSAAIVAFPPAEVNVCALAEPKVTGVGWQLRPFRCAEGPPPAALFGQVCVYAVTLRSPELPAALQLRSEEAGRLFVEGMIGVFLIEPRLCPRSPTIAPRSPSGHGLRCRRAATATAEEVIGPAALQQLEAGVPERP